MAPAAAFAKLILMSLSHDDVERVIRLLEASQFDELHLELDGFKLDLRRRGVAPAMPRHATPTSVAAAPAMAPVPTAAPTASPEKAEALQGQAGHGPVDIKAPMLGTFFHAPKPGDDPFVSVGSRVEPDTVIGIIEVMKLMNSVSAGISGVVTEIVAPDAQLVEFDQVLVRVRPL